MDSLFNPEYSLNTGDANEPDLSVLAVKVTGHVIIEPNKTFTKTNMANTIVEITPETEVSFKLVDEAATRLVSLNEIDQDLSQKGVIDTQLANIVAESFHELFSVIPKNAFTGIPTKAGYRDTKSFMKDQIAKEEAALMDLFKTYIDDPFKMALDLFQNLKETHIPGLIRVIDSLRSEFQSNQEKLEGTKEESKETIFKADLLSFDVTTISTQFRAVAEFKEAVATVQSVFKDPKVQIFFWGVVHGLNQPTENSGVTMSQFINFILNPRLIERLDATLKQFEQDGLAVQELVTQSREISDKPELISAFVVKHADQFKAFGSVINEYSALIYNLMLLNLSIKQMAMAYLEV